MIVVNKMFSIIPLFVASVFVQTIDAQYLGNAFANPGFSQPLRNPGYPANPGFNQAAENAALNMAYGNLANGMAMNPAFASMAGYNQELGSFNGGGLIVTSSSPIAPSGMTVQSENLVVEGPLAVTGQLPFLGVVEVEGPLAATGQGAVAFGCGNGNVGIVGENLNAPEPYANLRAGYNLASQGNMLGRLPGNGLGLY
ncbi:unnamed protein product [Leptosia nina]|uniref:Uncharacterized protein n=1 Tax=Leptosia nina TaxID=320188 RepID=A0AAV1JHW3_9NEOP